MEGGEGGGRSVAVIVSLDWGCFFLPFLLAWCRTHQKLRVDRVVRAEILDPVCGRLGTNACMRAA